jgi:hypothetical protein
VLSGSSIFVWNFTSSSSKYESNFSEKPMMTSVVSIQMNPMTFWVTIPSWALRKGIRHIAVYNI